MVEYKPDNSTLFDSRGRTAVPINTGLYSEMLALRDGQQGLIRENTILINTYNAAAHNAQLNADMGNMMGVVVPAIPVGHEMDDFGVITEVDLGLKPVTDQKGNVIPPTKV